VHLTETEVVAMTQNTTLKAQRSDGEREGLTDDTAAETAENQGMGSDAVENDSLGTVDMADSTGLDADLDKKTDTDRDRPGSSPESTE